MKVFIGSNFSIERVEVSKKHMLDFMSCDDLSGRVAPGGKLGFELKNIATGEANTESLFVRTAAD